MVDLFAFLFLSLSLFYQAYATWGKQASFYGASQYEYRSFSILSCDKIVRVIYACRTLIKLQMNDTERCPRETARVI